MRKIYFLICIVITFYYNGICYTQSGWFTINLGTTDHLEKITFINNDTGYIIANDGSNNKYLLKSSNAGNNWLPIYFFNEGLYTFQFINANTGYLLSNKLYKTTNGGDNWFNIYLDSTYNYFTFNFYNVNNGIIYGWLNNSMSKLFKTTDGGVSWIETETFNYNIRFSTIKFTSPDTVIAHGKFYSDPYHYDYLYKSTNGGINWYLTANLGINGLINLKFYSNSVGYMSDYWSNRIMKTTNGSLNWYWITDSLETAIIDYCFLDNNTGYISSEYGRIYKSVNGGLNWTNQILTGGANMNSIFFINSQTGYSCGQNGILKKTTNGGDPIGIKPVSNNVPDRFELYQNYPNPFNPTTKLRFVVKSESANSGSNVKSKIQLVIYDVMGREVRTLVNEEMNSGIYEMEFDGSNFTSAVYFYSLIVGDNIIDTKKMLLLK